MGNLTADKADSTIIACATPMAPSAISVIRISGEKATELLEALTGLKKPAPAAMRKCILDTGELKDSIMAAAFYSPRSYTGEDCVELYTHGSPAVVKSVIKFCIDAGARLAEGGEFTRRAYLNGKLDLTQAEGINDLINAETALQANAAFSAAEGALFARIEGLGSRIVSIAACIQAGLDYPEEGVVVPEGRDLKRELSGILSELNELTDSYSSGRRIGEGVKVVLRGNVNAGKSSLFNAILGYSRAIVDESEGTTRDSIDAAMDLHGMKFVFFDTAGFRKTDNVVENKGISRTKKLEEEADIIIDVCGGDDEVACDASVIRVRPRADLGVKARIGEISVSSTTGEGIEVLKEEIYSRAAKNGMIPKSDAITNYRHYSALMGCKDALTALEEEYDFVTEDIKTLRLRDALDALYKITGLIGSEEILDEIFKSFCVGK